MKRGHLDTPRPLAIDRYLFAAPVIDLPEGRDVLVEAKDVADALDLTLWQLHLCMPTGVWFRFSDLAWMSRSSSDLIWVRTFDRLDEQGQPVRVLEVM